MQFGLNALKLSSVAASAIKYALLKCCQWIKESCQKSVQLLMFKTVMVEVIAVLCICKDVLPLF